MRNFESEAFDLGCRAWTILEDNTPSNEQMEEIIIRRNDNLDLEVVVRRSVDDDIRYLMQDAYEDEME